MKQTSEKDMDTVKHQQIFFLFEIAEHAIHEWLSQVTDITIPNDNNVLKYTRALDIVGKNGKKYKVEAKLVSNKYNINTKDMDPNVLEAVGVVVYAIKTVYVAIASSIVKQGYPMNIGVKLNEECGYFDVQYIHKYWTEHEDIDKHISQLLQTKQDAHQNGNESAEAIEWNNKWQQAETVLRELDEKIKQENIYELVDKRNKQYEKLMKLGIYVKEI